MFFVVYFNKRYKRRIQKMINFLYTPFFIYANY